MNYEMVLVSSQYVAEDNQPIKGDIGGTVSEMPRDFLAQDLEL